MKRSPRGSLLDWYRPRRDAYPWRRSRDPYAILVSEVMLQQTQASRVAPAFERFLDRFPTMEALAGATRAEVVRAWDGLGYNRRAMALSEAARAIVREHGGLMPSDPEALRRLPGVGPYTAAAISSIAFGEPVAAVDTNVRRIVARLRLGVEADDAPEGRLGDLAGEWLDRADPGGWNQALMDLGREVCRPRPRCGACPLAGICRFPVSEARARPARRRQPRFEGSSRQVRGRIVSVLRRSGALTLASVERRCGVDGERVRTAVRDLHRDGVIAAGPVALAGRPSGRVRLAD